MTDTSDIAAHRGKDMSELEKIEAAYLRLTLSRGIPMDPSERFELLFDLIEKLAEEAIERLGTAQRDKGGEP